MLIVGSTDLSAGHHGLHHSGATHQHCEISSHLRFVCGAGVVQVQMAGRVRIPEIQARPLRITGKFPGYLSPSAGLKFADVPNGLAAISKAHLLFAFVCKRFRNWVRAQWMLSCSRCCVSLFRRAALRCFRRLAGFNF